MENGLKSVIAESIPPSVPGRIDIDIDIINGPAQPAYIGVSAAICISKTEVSIGICRRLKIDSENLFIQLERFINQKLAFRRKTITIKNISRGVISEDTILGINSTVTEIELTGA